MTRILFYLLCWAVGVVVGTWAGYQVRAPVERPCVCERKVVP